MNGEGAALVGEDLKGSDRQEIKTAQNEAEKILNRALRLHAPDFYGSFNFTAQGGRITRRQVVESEIRDNGS